MDWSFRKNWDEKAWSREIRKDELRISGYFRALPGCLDLPGEDDMIFKRLMSQPELVPTGVVDPYHTLKNEMEVWEDDAENDGAENNDPRRVYSLEAARRVKNLAVEWNLLAAVHLLPDYAETALRITCAFGKLLSRIYNFEDTAVDADTLNLRISLLKYMLLDLNSLVEQLDRLSAHPSCGETVSRFINSLAFVRENILDRLRDLRSTN